MYGRWLRNSFIYLLVLVAIVAIVFTVLYGSGAGTVDQTVDKFVVDVQKGQVSKVDVSGDTLTYKLKGEDTSYTTKMESGDTVRRILVDAGVKPGDANYPDVNIKGTSAWKTILSVLLTFAPIVIIIGVLFFFLRQAQGSNNQALNFGKKRQLDKDMRILQTGGVDPAQSCPLEIPWRSLPVPRIGSNE